MAFDAQVEDWQRMGMRLARTLDAGDPFGSVRAAVSFGHRYASDRDSLPQTNSERAFRLVAQATELIDYELPFAEPARADHIIAEARGMLEQARTLDPHCHDAARMIAAQDRPSFDEFYHYLTEGDAAVRAGCERARDAVNLPDPQACRLARDLAFLPYLRWLANEASRALICGRYRKAIEHATELARLDENGIADADLTLAIAHTKLEDQAALDELAARGGGPMGNAWLALATLAMAYKRRDMSAATQVTSQIIAKWPHAALTLELQDELQSRYTGGTVLHLYLGERIPDTATAKALIRKVFTNYKLPYLSLTPTFSVCPKHGYIRGEHFTCPECGGEAEVWSRVVGYLRPVQNFHKGKKQEYAERVKYVIKDEQLCASQD